MRRALRGIVTILAVIILGAGLSFAGNGKGPGNGTGPIHQITSPFTYTGTVLDLTAGEGLVLTTAEEEVTIYGIGPVRYWEAQRVDRPAVGEEITVSGYVVSLNGVERNIASAIITADGTTITLRDDDGKPLWQGKPEKAKGKAKGK